MSHRGRKSSAEAGVEVASAKLFTAGDCQPTGLFASVRAVVRRLRQALTLSCAVLIVPLVERATWAETVKPSLRGAAFRHELDLRKAPDVDAQSVVLRQSLFKGTVPEPTVPKRGTPEVRRAIPLPTKPTLPPRPAPLTPVPPTNAKGKRVPAEAYAQLGLQPTSFTPYDRYMSGARGVLEDVGDGYPATLAVASRLVETGRKFRYVSRDPYRPDMPEVTSRTKAGDCKSKSLWLYRQLNDPTALYVIGKAEKTAKSSHAWLYWYSDGRWWILDPTTRSSPLAASAVTPGRYVPYYSFGRYGAYRHDSTRIFGSREDAPAVAAQRVNYTTPSRSSAGRSRSR